MINGEYLREQTKKIMDFKILECVNEELVRLENIADIEEYKKQISIRREFFNLVFSDFNFYIQMIREKNGYGIRKPIMEDFKNVLDKVLNDKIFIRLEKVYRKASNLCGETLKIYNCEVSQIMDRQIGIGQILSNFEQALNIVQNYQKDLEVTR